MKKYLEILGTSGDSSDFMHEKVKNLLIQGGISFVECIEYQNEEKDISDILFEDVKEFAIKNGKISTAMIQRKFKVGYSRSARLIDMLEDNGIIGKANGAEPRKVLIEK